MEVWGLEAHSAAYVLREMMTVKADDVEGREALTKAIMADGGNGLSRGTVLKPGLPDSFGLLLSELRSLGLNPELILEKSEASMKPLSRPEEANGDFAIGAGD